MATPAMDLFAGQLARDAGMAQAAESRNELVNDLREHLKLVVHGRGANGSRLLTADDFDNFLTTIGKTHKDLGNAAGVVFKHPDFEFTGLYTPSKRRSSKARTIRVWRLL